MIKYDQKLVMFYKEYHLTKMKYNKANFNLQYSRNNKQLQLLKEK